MRKKAKSARALAYEVLFRFEKTLDRLDDLSERILRENELSARERRFFKNLTAGVVRHRLYLDWIGGQLYKGRYKKLLFKFKILLRLALYERIFLTAIPPHATLNEYVNLAKKKVSPLQAKILNGLLRSYLRQKDDLKSPASIKDPIKRLSIQYSFPEWMIKRWIGFWGEQETEALCAALNQPPDFDVRINTQKINPAKFKKLLLENDVPFIEAEYDPAIIRVKEIQPFLRHHWFEKGYCVIQDESAALVVKQMDLQKGVKVLDMCSAPGGKYINMLQQAPEDVLLIAMDADVERLMRVKANVEHLLLPNAHYVAGDGRSLPFKTQFDRILIDAPCSGLGVIRKHPDIKWRRSFEEIVEFSKIQQALLESADPFLKEGGLLVYSTCTIDYFENENVALDFLNKHADKYQLQKPKVPDDSMLNENFMRIHPHKHNMDGGFCAVFKKKP